MGSGSKSRKMHRIVSRNKKNTRIKRHIAAAKQAAHKQRTGR